VNKSKKIKVLRQEKDDEVKKFLKEFLLSLNRLLKKIDQLEDVLQNRYFQF